MIWTFWAPQGPHAPHTLLHISPMEMNTLYCHIYNRLIKSEIISVCQCLRRDIHMKFDGNGWCKSKSLHSCNHCLGWSHRLMLLPWNVHPCCNTLFKQHRPVIIPKGSNAHSLTVQVIYDLLRCNCVTLTHTLGSEWACHGYHGVLHLHLSDSEAGRQPWIPCVFSTSSPWYLIEPIWSKAENHKEWTQRCNKCTSRQNVLLMAEMSKK